MDQIQTKLSEMKKEPRYSPIFELLRGSVRQYKSTTIESLQARIKELNPEHHVSQSDLRSFFTELHKLNLGEFSKNVSNKYHTFTWKHSVHDIVNASNGLGPLCGTGTISEPGDDESESGSKLVEHKENSPTCDTDEIVFLLRRDFKVYLKLPNDLTHVEVDRFKKFLDSLPVV